MADLDKALAIAVKTGKVSLGTNSTLKSVSTGKVRLVVVASNCPKKVREDLEYYSKLSKILIIPYSGTSLELGRVCGKPFLVSALAIRDPGDSDILSIAVETDV